MLQIPLHDRLVTHRLVWIKEVTGVYTVKSAYHLMRNGSQSHTGDNNERFWRSLWNLKVPPKAKNLFWRACTGYLPTKSQLITKRVVMNASCPVSGMAAKTIIHCLVTCRDVQQCWNRVGIGTQNIADADFLGWSVTKFEILPTRQKCLLVMVCLAIWGARNELVWQNRRSPILNIVTSAIGHLDQWQSAQKFKNESPNSGLQQGDGAERWSVPVSNSIKVNVDAALFEEERKYVIGMVVRDNKGLLQEGCTKLFRGKTDVAIVEAMGVREALSWLKNHPGSMATVETDCLTVIQAIRSSVDMVSVFGTIIQECKTLLNDMSNVTLVL